ncbi:hypothetical protein B0920_20545 [Massilia sp. KIM]|uniref:YgiW/YdeI family stress tolerance OB fold protein n=1 Tax=Massilia sp. KIM TaxID=1955422 RepID=UPI0009CB3515|nr:NirD/YgiW/YdeI family stress tolerance protein [Massilia sp. KIM]OON59679.1 hypothetical protein B0920_20545 [Massilia sp. KIM]
MKRLASLTCIAVLLAGSAAAIAQTAGYTGPSALAQPAAAAAKAYTGPSTQAQPAAGAAAAAAKGYAGPSSVPLMTVKDLLDKGKDDQAVRLKGRLLSHKGGDEYEFADQSGKMTVEIDADRFPAGTTVDHNTLVELSGEFDKETFGDSSLDVEQLTVAAK